MNSAIAATVSHNGVDKSSGGLIQIPSLDNEFGDGMLVVLEECLSEARCAFLSLWVVDTEIVEGLCERLSSPDFYARACDPLKLLQDVPFPFDQAVPGLLDFVNVDADASHSHVNETWEQIQFEISDAPQFLFAQLDGKVFPQLQSQFRIGFSVWTDVHSGHLPHFSFGIDTELPGSLS